MSDELRASDLDAVRQQLGREPTVPFSVVARCGDGHPLVIRNRPLDADRAFAEAVDASHARYAAERGDLLAGAERWGGVGGTRRGLKCLHAHYAYHLAGGDDAAGRWTAEQVEPVHGDGPAGRVAAIDQGTNSTRLLVLEPRSDTDPREIARDMVITRLGKGVDGTGALDPAAIERAMEAIARFARRARALHAERIVVGATSAPFDDYGLTHVEMALR